MGVNERKFCGTCKQCVWKEVCWWSYEEGQLVVEGRGENEGGREKEGI